MPKQIDVILSKCISILRRLSFTRKYINIVLRDKDINELAKWTTITTFFKLLSLPVGLATSLIISRWYGADAMGLYSLVMTISWLSVIIWLLGLATAMPRFLGEARAKKSSNEAAIYRSSLTVILFSGIVISILLYIAAGWLSYTVFDEPRLYFALQVTAIFIFPIMWYKLNTHFLLASKKIWHSEMIREWIVPLAMLVLIYISYRFRPTYYIPIWAYLLTSAGGVCISLYILWKHQYVAIRGPMISLKKILRISGPMLITWMVLIIVRKTDILMLGRLTNTTEVGIYQVVFSLAVIVPIWLKLIWSIIRPKISELFWEKKKKELQKTISVSIRWVSLIALFIFIIFNLFPKFLLWIWGVEFVNGINALRILSFGFLIHALCGSNKLYMNGTGKEILLQKIVITAAVINILLNYLLIPKLGIEWAAWASLISITVQNLTISFRIWKKDGIKTFVCF